MDNLFSHENLPFQLHASDFGQLCQGKHNLMSCLLHTLLAGHRKKY